MDRTPEQGSSMRKNKIDTLQMVQGMCIKPKLNRRKAIRERCLDCSAQCRSEVRECAFHECSLFDYRTGTGKQEPAKRDQAIRAYCRWCMNGQPKEVSICSRENCTLHAYRNTGAFAGKGHIGAFSENKRHGEGESKD